jgi:hypothetical protein
MTRSGNTFYWKFDQNEQLIDEAPVAGVAHSTSSKQIDVSNFPALSSNRPSNDTSQAADLSLENSAANQALRINRLISNVQTVLDQSALSSSSPPVVPAASAQLLLRSKRKCTPNSFAADKENNCDESEIKAKKHKNKQK